MPKLMGAKIKGSTVSITDNYLKYFVTQHWSQKQHEDNGKIVLLIQ